jgi:hypothetical protein
MNGWRRRAVLLGAAVLLTAAILLVDRLGSTPTSTSKAPDGVTAVALGRTVHVDSRVPGTRFLPLGSAPEDGRTLSAQHAYNLLVSGSPKLSPIPATVRPYYGLLTDLAASPKAVQARVWGFTVLAPCHDTSPAGAPTSSQLTRCRLWEFVDARTGRNLGMISQEVLPD